jgi:hypothetical protein
VGNPEREREVAQVEIPVAQTIGAMQEFNLVTTYDGQQVEVVVPVDLVMAT